MDATATNALTLPLPHLAEQFLLDPDVTYLNHGSFGACPRPVFEEYQRWQRELEANPVVFMRRLPGLLAETRARLAAFVGTERDDVVFIPNATHAINAVARSIKLQPGDEVLSNNHEYGAVERTWRFNCLKSGATFVNHPIPLPVESPEAVVEQLWKGVTERTKVISFSHITSSMALVFPVAEVCRRARQAGILTVIDGAHALGQIDIDIKAMAPDYYTGNAHKWLSAPKGAAFLYVRPEHQNSIEPLVVSHGWRSVKPGPSLFLDHFTWIGTSDHSAYLSVAKAIEFQEQNRWPEVRAACHALAREAERRLLALSDNAPISPESMWIQMRTIPIPGKAEDYKDLWERHKIVIPVFERDGQTFLRISIQAYNKPQDVDRLVDVVRRIGLQSAG